MLDGISCPACGGALVFWRSVPSFEPLIGPRAFDLARCEVCGTGVTLGDPVSEAHSAGAYGPAAPRGASVVAPLLGLFDRQRLGLLPGPPASLLDVGAGRGRFVAAARRAGYDAVGLEPSLREPVVGLVEGDISSYEPAEPVDVITLWHVLEHLDDPGVALSRLRSWLAPGGSILVGVPNLSSLQAVVGGSRWYHLELPRHRVHFSLLGLRMLLASCGFAVVSVSGVLLEHNPFGMWQSAVSAATARPSYLYNLLKRNAPVSGDLAVTVAALPWVPVAALAELYAGVTGRGGTVAVLARRVS